MARRLAAIVFTDIAGYTSIAQADEAAALRLLREQEKIVRPLLESHRGRKVKSMGDGLLLEFENALDAVECGVALQRQLYDRNSREGSKPLQLRVGIHLGDVQRQGTDILGDAVNIASRIEPLAEPGGVCLSEQVFAQVRNKVPYTLENLGPKTLKGVRDPVNVYRVMLPWAVEGAAPSPSTYPRIAVLPLTNISPDPRDEYFADGLTEELISMLSQVRGLRVISHTSVNQYKGTSKSVAQIGSELGVASILEGSVRKAGDQLRIAIQLIDTRTDEHRWAETYDRKLENVFAIQADVAERAAGALKVELLRSEREAIEEKPTSDMEAYASFLRAIQLSHSFFAGTTEDTRKVDLKAEGEYEDALRRDPNFSAAMSGLATHLIAVAGITRPPKPLFARARELVTKALELNPNSSDAHTAKANLAMQSDRDWARAEAEFQQAIVLNPSSSGARLWYGYLLDVLQRFPEAKKQTLAAIDLDPLWPLARFQFIAHLDHGGEFDAAVELRKKIYEREPDNVVLRWGLGFSYARAGRPQEALELLESPADVSDLGARTVHAMAMLVLGRPEEFRKLATDLEQGRLPGYFSDPVIAGGYAALGERERAFHFLERDSTEGDRILWANYQELVFDSIRDDPRFVALIRAMGLPTTLGRPLVKLPSASGR
jgi:adenylate cyclase